MTAADPALQVRPLAPADVAELLRIHHRITMDPSVTNAAAIRSYEKAGFVAVGVMRAYERDVDSDEWHDGLLMEVIAR